MDTQKQEVMAQRLDARTKRKLVRRARRIEILNALEMHMARIKENTLGIEKLKTGITFLEAQHDKMLDEDEGKKTVAENIAKFKVNIEECEKLIAESVSETPKLHKEFSELDPEAMRKVHEAAVKAEIYRRFRAKHPVHGSGKKKKK